MTIRDRSSCIYGVGGTNLDDQFLPVQQLSTVRLMRFCIDFAGDFVDEWSRISTTCVPHIKTEQIMVAPTDAVSQPMCGPSIMWHMGATTSGPHSAGNPDYPPDLRSMHFWGLVDNLDCLLNAALVWTGEDRVISSCVFRIIDEESRKWNPKWNTM